MASLEYLDDSDWSIDPEDEPTHWLALLIAVVAFGLFLIFANRRIEVPPLVVKFPAPVAWPNVLDTSPRIMTCIWTNGVYTRPNWEDPHCTAENARKKGWW